MKTVIVGDGAVGRAVAVALSSKSDVLLAGPPGTVSQRIHCSVDDSFSAVVDHISIGDVKGSFRVVIALKAYDIASAVPFIRDFAHGSLVCLSNGMGLDEEFGSLSGSVEYAVLTSGFRVLSRHRVFHSPGELFCQAGGTAAELFSDTFFSVTAVDDVEEIRWSKWYANSIINTLGALSGMPNDRIADSEYAYAIPVLARELEPLMPSCASLRRGREMLSWLLGNSHNRCSMLQDVQAGRRTEIDYLTGYLLHLPEPARPLCRELVNRVREGASGT